MGDLTTGAKKDMFLFKEMERKILHVIAGCFNLEWPMPEIVKEVDLRTLATERRDVMRNTEWDWELGVEPYDQLIKPIDYIQAEVSFLSRFNVIVGAKR